MATADRIIVYGGIVNHRFDIEVWRLMRILRGDLPDRSAHVWHKRFPDGEPGFRIEHPEQLAGRHIIVFSCIADPRHELALRDLVMAAKHQYGGATVTVVMPFLRYRRQDRAEYVHEITRLRWFLKCLKDWGADNLVVCEPHSVKSTQKFADEFGIRLFIADPTRLFAEALRGPIQAAGGVNKFCIYSPDFGSVGRALRLGTALSIDVLASPKKRGPDGKVTPLPHSEVFLTLVHEQFGSDAPVSCNLEEARGRIIIMREDEVNTAGTSKRTMEQRLENGAAAGWLVATHPVCSPGWKDNFWPFGERSPFDAIWFGNTRLRGEDETRYEGSSGGRVTTVSMEPVVAEALLSAIATLP